MSFDPTLSLPASLQMHAGAQATLLTRDMATCGMPLQIVAFHNLRAQIVRQAGPADDPVADVEIGGFPVVGLRLTAMDPGPAHLDIAWTGPGQGPDRGHVHHITIQVHPADTALPGLSYQVADQISSTPPPTKAQISAFLDATDGHRPYGARKVDTATMVLEQIAQALAIKQALACTRSIPVPPLDDVISTPARAMLAQMGFDRHALPRAIEAFIAARLAD